MPRDFTKLGCSFKVQFIGFAFGQQLDFIDEAIHQGGFGFKVEGSAAGDFFSAEGFELGFKVAGDEYSFGEKVETGVEGAACEFGAQGTEVEVVRAEGFLFEWPELLGDTCEIGVSHVRVCGEGRRAVGNGNFQFDGVVVRPYLGDLDSGFHLGPHTKGGLRR